MEKREKKHVEIIFGKEFTLNNYDINQNTAVLNSLKLVFNRFGLFAEEFGDKHFLLLNTPNQKVQYHDYLIGCTRFGEVGMVKSKDYEYEYDGFEIVLKIIPSEIKVKIKEWKAFKFAVDSVAEDYNIKEKEIEEMLKTWSSPLIGGKRLLRDSIWIIEVFLTNYLHYVKINSETGEILDIKKQIFVSE